jgi:epoxyqueuosine reductase QueG
MEQADFSRLFKGSAVKRAKFSGWQRNFAFAERRQAD